MVSPADASAGKASNACYFNKPVAVLGHGCQHICTWRSKFAHLHVASSANCGYKVTAACHTWYLVHQVVYDMQLCSSHPLLLIRRAFRTITMVHIFATENKTCVVYIRVWCATGCPQYLALPGGDISACWSVRIVCLCIST